jgi:hypothetical protein
MDRSIRAGVYGFLLAIAINFLASSVNLYLYFVPSFLAAIFVIYIFRLGTLKDGLVTAFMTYIFTDGILSTIVLATYYFANKSYPSFNVDVWTMLLPIVQVVTAVIAGYIGVWLAQKRKPAQELPTPIPPQVATV